MTQQSSIEIIVKQNISKLQVSEETQDFIELLKALNELDSKIYNVIQKYYGDKQADNITEKEFYKPFEEYQERILHYMNQSVLDKLYSRDLKDVI